MGPRDIEYIASLNDSKAFEGVNLGIIKRSRKNDKRGEKWYGNDGKNDGGNYG